MSHTEEQKRAIRIAEKLYKLAEGTNFEEEAETALLKAQAILHEYDLTIEDLSFYEKHAHCSQRGVVLVDTNCPGWVRLLAEIFINIYDCRALIHSAADGRTKITYVGVEPDVTVVEQSFIICYRHLMLKKFAPGTRQKAKTDYRMGFCAGLDQKLHAQKQRNTVQTPGLVPIKKELADKAFTEFFPDTRTGRKIKQFDLTESFWKGQADGKAFNISQGVTARRQEKQECIHG